MEQQMADHDPPATTRHSQPRWLGVDLVHNRWLFPAAGLLATALGGAAYAYSVFISELEDPVMGIGLRREEATSAIGVALLLVSLMMFLGGLIVDRYGPRGVLATGGALASGGMLLTAHVESPIQFILTFGVMFGTGVGLAYTACAVALAARWYPDAAKRGAAIGWSIVGFGAAGAVAAPLWTLGIDRIGWRDTFTVTGVLYLVVFAILLTLVRFPPRDWAFDEEQGWHPAGPGEDPAPDAPIAVQPWDLTLREALRNRYLYLLGVLFMLGMFGGLLAIGQLAPYAEEHLGIGAGAAGLLVAFYAIGNGSGRPTAGAVSARIGVRRTMCIAYAVLALGLLTLALATVPAVAFVAVIFTGLAFGASLALTPIMVALLFGVSYLARLYGLVFIIGFGFGGLLGGLTGGRILEGADGDYTLLFLLAAGLSGLSAVLVRVLLPAPGAERQHTPRSQAEMDELVAGLAELAALRDGEKSG